jgi:hypothetical protein
VENTSNVERNLHAELWISWASLLRSYAAAHGMNSHQFAVIEFGEDVIVARAGSKWVRITHAEFESSEDARAIFALNENGTVSLDGKIEEMDMAAEQITRELMQ